MSEFMVLKKEENEIQDKIYQTNSYFSILEIPKISLKKELYDVSDKRNDVNQNILVHSESIFPGENKSFVILAAHSGNGAHAYFKNLYQLERFDEIKLYYQNKIYIYEIVEIEKQAKTGTLLLKQNKKDMLLLITCTYHDSKSQTIYYAVSKNVQNIDEI